ncbi:glycosyltransferase [Photobacterium damselae subsp. damselae]|uniref:glycosyltransferase family 2 protein n=1 Tax=Photobacterium damselae TaxID=38293 RepID=UPI001F217CF1|nr:glycosyltransferase family 2 protein [Photobacterium damselae]UKA06989.1 glycosyltransferase [Photobacterium damselae subsp. damselae]UKA22094.1 glycosyltransferase [Photobacterium damselae subsp. damselae]
MFTVVIPTFRSYDTLLKSLKSCQHPLIKEIIVVDDNNKEERELFKKESVKDNIEILFNNKNIGVTASRNKGYFRSKQEFVIFLDSDDELMTDRLSMAAEIISKSSSDIFLFSTQTHGVSNSNFPNKFIDNYIGLFSMANSGERLLIIRKNNFKPFLGMLRGHELCGLFLWGVKSNAVFEWQPLSLREYNQGNLSSLSGQRLGKERASLISFGHKIISTHLFTLGKYWYSLKYFIKAFYYDYKSNCSR